MGEVRRLPKRCAWPQCAEPIREGEISVRTTDDRVYHAVGCYGLHLAVEAAKLSIEHEEANLSVGPPCPTCFGRGSFSSHREVGRKTITASYACPDCNPIVPT